MDRRTFLTITMAAAFLTTTKSSFAQDGFDPFSISSYMDLLSTDSKISDVSADIYFIRSWRIELAPRGYENDSGWIASSLENYRSIFNRFSSPGPAATLLDRFSGTPSFPDSANSMEMAFSANSSDFLSFIADIGLNPDSPAGQRMLKSLRVYGMLNYAAETGAEDHSYFWPFC